MRIRLAFLASIIAAAVLALALSACGSSSGGSDIASFCKSYVAFNKAGDAFNNINSGDVQAGKAAISDTTDALGTLADDSPDEIKDDVNKTEEWFAGARDAIANANTIADVESAGTAYTKDHPQPTDAYKAIDTYAAHNCNGDQPAGGTGGTDTGATDTTSTDAG